MTADTLGTWKNPPLAYVVAEIQISPHYSIENSIPIIQDLLRSEYPRTIEGTEVLPQPFFLQTGQQKVWQLIGADQSRGVYISTRAISLHATAYQNSRDFRDRWTKVLEKIAESNLAPFIERAGLRYIDLIVPAPNYSTQDYLAAKLQGLQTPPENTVKHRLFSLGIEDNGVTIQINTASPAPKGGVWPSTLQILQLRKPLVLERAEKAQRDGQSIGFIDVDCSVQVKELLDIIKLKKLYELLHVKMSATFGVLISELAKKEWM